MNHAASERFLQIAKSTSRGVSCDMSPEAVNRRLDIVDELRELAKDLQNSKRMGPLNVLSEKNKASTPKK